MSLAVFEPAIPSKLAAADTLLGPHGHWDRHTLLNAVIEFPHLLSLFIDRFG
jgi:hypothetical protein